MEKYYGIVEKRDYPLSDGEVSQHSDGIVDYETTPKARPDRDMRFRYMDIHIYIEKHTQESVPVGCLSPVYQPQVIR